MDICFFFLSRVVLGNVKRKKKNLARRFKKRKKNEKFLPKGVVQEIIYVPYKIDNCPVGFINEHT